MSLQLQTFLVYLPADSLLLVENPSQNPLTFAAPIRSASSSRTTANFTSSASSLTGSSSLSELQSHIYHLLYLSPDCYSHEQLTQQYQLIRRAAPYVELQYQLTEPIHRVFTERIVEVCLVRKEFAYEDWLEANKISSKQSTADQQGRTSNAITNRPTSILISAKITSLYSGVSSSYNPNCSSSLANASLNNFTEPGLGGLGSDEWGDSVSLGRQRQSGIHTVPSHLIRQQMQPALLSTAGSLSSSVTNSSNHLHHGSADFSLRDDDALFRSQGMNFNSYSCTPALMAATALKAAAAGTFDENDNFVHPTAGRKSVAKISGNPSGAATNTNAIVSALADSMAQTQLSAGNSIITSEKEEEESPLEVASDYSSDEDKDSDQPRVSCANSTALSKLSSFDPSNFDSSSSSESLIDYLVISELLDESERSPILQFLAAQKVKTIAAVGQIHLVQLKSLTTLTTLSKKKLWKVITKLKTANHAAGKYKANSTSTSNSRSSAANNSRDKSLFAGSSSSTKTSAKPPKKPLPAIPAPSDSSTKTQSDSTVSATPTEPLRYVEDFEYDSDSEDFVSAQTEKMDAIRERERRRLEHFTGNNNEPSSIRPSTSTTNDMLNDSSIYVQALQRANTSTTEGGSVSNNSSVTTLSDSDVQVYPVQKLRRAGVKQARELKLTNSEIWNCKGSSITACHNYSDIFCVTLKDEHTVCISFVNDHDFIYFSEEYALIIYQAINDKLAQLRRKEKLNLASALATEAQNFQQIVHRQSVVGRIQPNAAASEAKNDKSTISVAKSVGAHAARHFDSLFDDTLSNHELKLFETQPTMFSKKLNNNSAAGSTTTDGDKAQRQRVQSTSCAPCSGTTSPSSSGATSPTQSYKTTSLTPAGSAAALALAARRQAKLAQLTGQSEPQRLQELIDRCINEASTDEGKARTKFLKSWPNLKKKPASILAAIRQFMDSLGNYMVKKRLNVFLTMIHMPENYNNCQQKMSSASEELVKQIERGVQTGILLPLHSRIFDTVKVLSKSADEVVCANMIHLQTKHQSWFGIKAKNQCPNHWRSAIAELNKIDRIQLPCDKLTCILNTAKAIYAQWVVNVSNSESMLSADDFFPIFVYVLSRASITSPELTKLYLWGLCDRNSLNGEGGYYLTVFEAAVEHLRTVNTESAPSRSGPH